jgi:predicted nucleic acid-binding Zn ribbon protein
MRRTAPRLLGGTVRGFVAAISPATPLARVQEVWEQAVGGAVAQAARPTAERSGVLTITCAAAVWAHELSLMESELLARLNGALGELLLRELRCRAG